MTGGLSRYPEPGEDSTPYAPIDRRRQRTLAAAFDPSRNSLNALRLLFAGAVIVSHAWWLGGFGPEPALYGIKLGTAGVMGFFAISGYLITLSAKHSGSVGNFFVARFIRIYPALVVAALAVALVVAPLGAIVTGGRFDLSSALTFAGIALALSKGVMNTPAIGSSLRGNHDYLEWNGPLWTLTWEVVCYVVVAVIVFILRRSGKERHTALATAALFAVFTVLAIAVAFTVGFGSERTAFVLPLIATFLAGSLLAHYRTRLRVGVLPALLAVELAWAMLSTGLGPALAPLPLAYLVLCLGSLRTFSRIGSRYDVSYGVYIYGWPVQQLLAALHVPAVLPPLGYAALALIAVCPLAFLSCILVEQPAQRWRRAWIQRREQT